MNEKDRENIWIRNLAKLEAWREFINQEHIQKAEYAYMQSVIDEISKYNE